MSPRVEKILLQFLTLALLTAITTFIFKIKDPDGLKVAAGGWCIFLFLAGRYFFADEEWGLRWILDFDRAVWIAEAMTSELVIIGFAIAIFFFPTHTALWFMCIAHLIGYVWDRLATRNW